jgi:hypothetical protein
MSDGACPGHDAAIAKGGEGKPERRQENQASNAQKLNAARFLGHATRFPVVEEK